MTGSRWFALGIALAAAVASFWTAWHFVIAAGGDYVHAWAIPFCLELLALAAVREFHQSGDRVALLWFWPAFVTAVVINYAHGAAVSPVVGLLYVIPPVALVGAGHLVLRDIARAHKAAQDAAAHAAAQARARRPQPVDTPVDTAHTNGHKVVRTRSVTASDLAARLPDKASWDVLHAEHGSVNAVAAHLEVSRARLNHRRRELGVIK